MANIQNWLPFNHLWENGPGKEPVFSINPNDKGGATYDGITIGTWQMFAPRFLGFQGTIDNLRSSTAAQRLIIKKRGFWDVANADHIQNEAVAVAIVDILWHMGTGRTKELQAMFNHRFKAGLVVDGAFGPRTLAFINGSNPTFLFDAIQDWRKAKFVEIVRADPSQYGFLKGWINRIESLTQLAKKKAGLLQARAA